MSDVEILQAPPRFTREQIRDAVSPACEKAEASAAILFGSYARGTADRWSDVDLLFVAETDLPFVERFRLFMDVLDRLPGAEIVVYTPEELRRRGAIGLLYLVAREGVLLWGSWPAELRL